MRLLTFQARRFRWKTFSRTLDTVPEIDLEDALDEAVVAFIHAETADEAPEARARVFRHTLKHLKWLANKRGMTNVALHSFTHLGADNADPAMAHAFLEELAERLRATGYTVKLTPFGYFCEWDLSVYGESLAKVWKQI